MEKIGFLEEQASKMIEALRRKFDIWADTSFLVARENYRVGLIGNSLYVSFGGKGFSAEQQRYYSERFKDLKVAHEKWLKRGTK